MTGFINILWFEGINYRRHFIRNVLMSLLVILAVFILNFFASNLRYCEYLNNLVKSVGLYGDYMYVGIPVTYSDLNGKNSDEAAVSQYISEELAALKQEGYIEDFSKMQYAGDCVKASVELLKDLSYIVERGRWFSEEDCVMGEDGIVPVVIGSNLAKEYRVGDTFYCSETDSMARVIGVLKKNTFFLIGNVGGNGISLSDFSVYSDDLTVIGTFSEDEYMSNSPFFVKLSSPEYEDVVFEAIADIVDTFSFREMADRAYNENIYIARINGTLAFMAIVVCVTCVACGNMLASSDNRRCQAVYNLCGMEEKTANTLVVVDAVLKVFISAIIGVIVFYRYCGSRSIGSIYLDVWNGVVTMAAMAIVIVFTSVMPVMKLMKVSPVSIIGEL